MYIMYHSNMKLIHWVIRVSITITSVRNANIQTVNTANWKPEDCVSALFKRVTFGIYGCLWKRQNSSYTVAESPRPACELKNKYMAYYFQLIPYKCNIRTLSTLSTLQTRPMLLPAWNWALSWFLAKDWPRAPKWALCYSCRLKTQYNKVWAIYNAISTTTYVRNLTNTFRHTTRPRFIFQTRQVFWPGQNVTFNTVKPQGGALLPLRVVRYVRNSGIFAHWWSYFQKISVVSWYLV